MEKLDKSKIINGTLLGYFVVANSTNLNVNVISHIYLCLGSLGMPTSLSCHLINGPVPPILIDTEIKAQVFFKYNFYISNISGMCSPSGGSGLLCSLNIRYHSVVYPCSVMSLNTLSPYGDITVCNKLFLSLFRAYVPYIDTSLLVFVIL